MKEKISFIISIVIFEVVVLAYLYVPINKNEIYGEVNKFNETYQISSEDSKVIGIEEVDRENDTEKNIYNKNIEENENREELTRINEEEISMFNAYQEVSEEEISKSEEEPSIFKVKPTSIIPSLTTKEIIELLNIGRSLSFKDYMTIKDYLFEKDRQQAALDGIVLIQEKLSEEDYLRVREIADRFIYVDLAEELANKDIY